MPAARPVRATAPVAGSAAAASSVAPDVASSPTRPLTRGQVAAAAGVNPETIRVYERERLLPRPARTAAGYRQFPPDTVRRVRFVRQAQAVGFSLREIRELLALQSDPAADVADIRATADAKLAEIDAKIRDLQAMRDTLERLTGRCPPAGPLETCPIWECFSPEAASDASCCGDSVPGPATPASPVAKARPRKSARNPA